MHLLDTLPSPPTNLVHLVFVIDLEIFEIRELSETDWSPLTSFPYFDNIPSTELQVRAEKWGTEIPSVDLLNILNQDPYLTRLQKHHSFVMKAAEELVDSS